MLIDTKELRKMAQAATPGPWRIGAMESGRVAIDGVNGSEVTGFIDPEDGHLILAAANPQAILELLDRLEAAEEDIAIKEEVIDSLAAVVKRLDAQCDAAEKECDALRTALTDLLNDLEERAPLNIGKSPRVVACGNSVYVQAKAALEATP